MQLWKFFGRGLKAYCSGFRVNTETGAVMRALALLKDIELSEKTKVRYSIRLLLCPLSALRARLLPFEKQRRLILSVLDGLGAKSGGAGKGSEEKIVSLYQDCGMIYSALLQSYGIDLMTDRVDFRLLPELIAGISADTGLYRVMEIRAARLPALNSGNAEYVKRLQRLKSIYAVREKGPMQEELGKLFKLAANSGQVDS